MSRRVIAGLAAAVMCAATVALAGPADVGVAATSTGASSVSTAAAAPGVTVPGSSPVRQVTLVTGDRVSVGVDAKGKPVVRNITPAPRSSGGQVAFQTIGHGESLYVLPSDAISLVAAHRLDWGLFDVAYLARNGYTDDADSRLPVIVEYPKQHTRGAVAAHAEALPASTSTHTLESIHAAALTVSKAHAADFWQALTRSNTGSAQPAPKVWLDRKVHADLDESVPQIGAPAAWAAGLDGSGVTVAVLDTGIDATHPDFAGKIDATASFLPGVDSVADGFGHGTHVASIIAGTGAASEGKYTGVAPGAHLMVGKVCDDSGSCPDSSVIDGMEWAAGHGARIVNMSLGGSPTDGTDPLSQAVDELSAADGTLFVIAAGNAGPTAKTIGTPGAADAALTVAAVDKSDELASFSSRGPRAGDRGLKPDIAAPGVDITAARAAGTTMGGGAHPVDDYYTTASGTSMATPHVAGAAAILAEEHPDWTGQQLKAALMSTAKDDGYSDYEQGTGRVDVARAFSQQVYADGSLDFGNLPYPQTEPVTKTLTYTNGTDHAVRLHLTGTLTGYTGKAAPRRMLRLNPKRITVPAHQTAPVTVTVNPRVRAGRGAYQGTIRATNRTGTIQVTTAVGVYNQPPTANLTVKAVLPDGASDATVSGWTVFAVDGRSDIHDLPPATQLPAGWQGTATLPEGGVYSVSTTISWRDAAGDWNYALPTSPQVKLTQDTTVTFDLNQAKKLTVKTPKPTESYDAWFGYQRVDAANEWQLTSSLQAEYGAQNYWALPTRNVTVGSFRSFSQHLLGAPLVRMKVRGIGGAKLHPRYQGPDLAYPKIDGTRSLPLVYARHGLPEDFTGMDVHGKLVLLSLDDICPDACTGDALDRVRNAANAGAAAVLAFSATGRAFLDPSQAWPIYPIPTLSIPADEGRMLVDQLEHAKVTVRTRGNSESPYVYALKFSNDSRISKDMSHKVKDAGLYQVDERFHADTAPSQVRWSFDAIRFGDFVSRKLGMTATARTQRITYFGPVSPHVVWELQAGNTSVSNATQYSTYVFAESGDGELNWGSQPEAPSDWASFIGPAAMRVAGTGFCGACRAGDTFTPLFRLNGGGDPYRAGRRPWYDNCNPPPDTQEELHLYSNGQEIPLEVRTGSLLFFSVCEPAFTLPANYGRYTLTERHGDYDPHSIYSTESNTTWTFASQRPTDSISPSQGYCVSAIYSVTSPTDPCQPEQLLYLRYDLGLDLDNTLPAGSAHTIAVTGYHNQFVSPEPATKVLKLWVTFDDGAHWKRVQVSAAGDNRFTGTIVHPPLSETTGAVGLRVRAKDSEGNTINQTIYRAYGLSDAGPAMSGKPLPRQLTPMTLATTG